LRPKIDRADQAELSLRPRVTKLAAPSKASRGSRAGRGNGACHRGHVRATGRRGAPDRRCHRLDYLQL